jgi:hypothetical protein
MKDRRNLLSTIKNKLAKLLVDTDTFANVSSSSNDSLITVLQSIQVIITSPEYTDSLVEQPSEGSS